MFTVCVATTVHYPLDTRIYFKEVNSLSKYFLVDYYAQGIPDFRIETSGKYYPLPKATTRFQRITTNLYLAKKLLLTSYDIYHFHDPEMLLLALILKIKKCVVIFDMHENMSVQVSNKEWIPWLLRRPTSWVVSVIERLMPKAFDSLILAEDSYCKKFNHQKQAKLSVIHNYPISQNYVKNCYDFNEFKMVYVGDIREVRGIFEMLEILLLGVRDNLKIKLIIIGRYATTSLENKCNNYILENNLGDNFLFLGRLPNNQIYPILKKCDLGLALLHPIPNYISSYPTKIFEYMNVGLPTLSSDFKLWQQIIIKNKCGQSVNPFDTKEAYSKVKEYYCSKKLREVHGTNGRLTSLKKYTWQKEEKKLKDLYDALLMTEYNRSSK